MGSLSRIVERPDTQSPRGDFVFGQKSVKSNLWGKLCPSTEIFPYWGNALQLWYIVVFVVRITLCGTYV
jgi:hypothetical protein